MANPVFKCSCEILAHYQCGACEKWWSIGDAEVRDYWFCSWCGARNAAAADSTDCDEDGVPYWDVPRGVLPECAAYIARDADEKWYAYQRKPVLLSEHGFFVDGAGPTIRLFDSVPNLSDIPADQWHDSLRRVRLVG